MKFNRLGHIIHYWVWNALAWNLKADMMKNSTVRELAQMCGENAGTNLIYLKVQRTAAEILKEYTTIGI